MLEENKQKAHYAVLIVLFYIMKKQNYQNHRMFYPPHHFIFLPLMAGLTIYGTIKAFNSESHKLEWILFSIVSFCIVYLAVMLRQHYALGNQDRIIRLEFRLRYFEIFGESAGSVEHRLSFSQMAALRFAGDEEFTRLLERALNENISGDQIKKAITDWQADHMRL